MADRHPEPDSPELRARWGAFAWTEANAAKAKEIVARYPAGRQRSAVMPLLDLAQRQVGAEENTQAGCRCR
jgi:NADH-quinone oxidoreductase subunit E